MKIANFVKILLLIMLPLYITLIAEENEEKIGNKKNYLYHLLKGDSLFNKEKYSQSYNQFIIANKIAPEKEGSLIGLYNSSIFKLDYKNANNWANNLCLLNNSEMNIERVIYSNALIGNYSLNETIIYNNSYDSLKYKHSNKEKISQLAGWGLYNSNYFIEARKWFKKEFKKYPNNDELKKGIKLTKKLLNKKISSSSLYYIPFVYDSNEEVDKGYYLNLNTKYGDKIDNINFSIGYQSVTLKDMDDLIVKYDVKNTVNTVLDYNYHNRYYLTYNDSLLLDTIETYNNSYQDTIYNTYYDTVKVNENNGNNGNNRNNTNITQTELALSYEYNFSSLYKNEALFKYSFVKNSSITSLFLIADKSSFDLGNLDIEIDFSGVYYSGTYTTENSNTDYETSYDSTSYAYIDTSVYINSLGNEEMEISQIDTFSFTTTLTETKYLTDETKNENFYSLQFSPKISYVYDKYFIQAKGYFYSIIDSYTYSDKLRYFIELKSAVTFDYFSIFSGYNFGEVNILHTDNNRYFSMTSSDDIDDFDYTYYLGASINNKDKTLEFTYKFKKEIYNDYEINAHLIGIGYTF